MASIDILKILDLFFIVPILAIVAICTYRLILKKDNLSFNFSISTLSSAIVLVCSLFLYQYSVIYHNYPLEKNYAINILGDTPLYIGYYIDDISTIFLTLCALAFLISNIFAYKYLIQNKSLSFRYFTFSNILMTGLFYYFTSSNLVLSTMTLMTVSILTYLFSNFFYKVPSVQIDSKKALKIDFLADFIILLGSFGFLYFSNTMLENHTIPTAGFNNVNTLGLYSFASLEPMFFALLCILFIFAILTKCSQFPFLSKAHFKSNAPDPIFSILVNPIIMGAGLFLLLRLYPILNLIPLNFEILKYVGILSAFLGVIISVAQTQLKKIIAYISLSQLGLCFVAIGFQAQETSTYFLICATISTMLFSFVLNAISHCTGYQDDTKFLGGLRKKAPSLTYFYIISSLSLSGFLFAGYDGRLTLLNSISQQKEFVFIGLFIVFYFFLTFSIFRIYFKIFEGKYKGSFEVIKPSKLMGFFLIGLCAICMFFGKITQEGYGAIYENSGSGNFFNSSPNINILALLACVLGYFVAQKIYYLKEKNTLKLGILKTLAHKRFYLDNFIDFVLSRKTNILASVAHFVEKYIVQAPYKFIAYFLKTFAYLTNLIQAKKLNTQIFILFLIISIILTYVIIVYFRTSTGG